MAEPETLAADDAAAPEAAALVVPAEPPVTEACPWPVAYINCDTGQCDAYAAYGDQAEQARLWFEAMATDILWNATGQVFGVCDQVVRPCRDDCSGNAQWASTFWGRGPGFDPGFPRMGMGGAGTGGFYPVLVSGQWFNITCGCLGTCSCSPSGPASLSLPGPVQSVEEVTIDGIVVPPTAYRIDRQRWLIRTDGGVWPRCQDMNAADDAQGSFVVRYRRGVPVPAMGSAAVGRLACELALAWCGSDDCALPERIQTITRQGLTVGVNTSDVAWAQTGIWAIDNWVTQVTKPRPFASVRSVDIPVR